MATRKQEPDDFGVEDTDRPSFMRVERFLHGIEDRRAAAQRTRWIVLAVVAAIGGVATLTALGIAPVEAEHAVLSASVLVAGIALGRE